MRAYKVIETGQPPQLEQCAMPAPAKGEVLVKIFACGLNFADLLMIKGKYQDTPDTPFTLGLELAGRIEAVGDGVNTALIGTSVAIYAGQGGLAEYGCFPVDRCVPMPDNMSYSQAAAFQIAYGTSHVALDYKAQLKAGETLLVLGAAGGVGLTAVEIGKRMGARVIAVARGEAKLEVAHKAGADICIDAGVDDLREQVKALGGADVVYDAVGGDLFRAAFRATNPDGRILAIGHASGDVPQIPANHLLVKNISVLGLYWGGYLKFKPAVLTDSMAQLFDWFAEGGLTPHISHELPLHQADKALDLLKSRKSTGKVVVTMHSPA